ncbi:MAG: hypothetical protein CM15mP36_16530 [Flavobacteriales bacterium]|nr:MAG: hypothetical protein CM15mP36_16530 [Flavobacteriales bacterium]
MATTAFNSVFDGGSFSNLEQPSGPDIDAVQATIMNQAQFRKFAGHNSAVFNFLVNTTSSGELAGIRWYELRQNGDGKPWVFIKKDLYAPEGDMRLWQVPMDLRGNIGRGKFPLDFSKFPL